MNGKRYSQELIDIYNKCNFRIVKLTEDEKGVIGNNLLQKIMEECDKIFSFYIIK
jgi:hypothetical protein